MVDARLIPAIARARSALEKLAASDRRASGLIRGLGALGDRTGNQVAKLGGRVSRVGQELVAASDRARWSTTWRNDFYGASYFGEGRDPSGDRQGGSGYASYDRLSSNADVAGFVIWRTFGGARTALDVGCATGFLVEVVRELGLQARGCDLSPYAIEHAVAGAKGHIEVGDLLAGLPYTDGEFDVVSALETLEHLPPAIVPEAIREIRRVCRGFAYLTIPSFGPNLGGGPDGYFEGKVRPERQQHYEELDPGYEGPVPYDDLARDATGEPVEGHLSIASFGWWTRQFEQVGFERRPDIEKRIYADITPGGLQNPWDIYVLAVPGADELIAADRKPGATLVDLGLRHPLFGTA